MSADSREGAIERALAALREYAVLGIRTNIPFLIRVLGHSEFRAGRLHTGFVEAHLGELLNDTPGPDEALAAAAVIQASRASAISPTGASPADPWSTLTGWGR